MRRIMFMAALLGLVGLTAPMEPARAAVVFDNFDVGDGYDTSIGYTIATAASTVGSNAAQGIGFTPSITTNLDTIEVAISLVSGLNEVVVKLFDDAGGVPGSELESFTFTGVMGVFGAFNPPLLASSVAQPLLTAGQQYYLVAFASADTWAGWYYNSIGDTGPRVISTDNGATYSVFDLERAAARVTGTSGGPVVPEPSTVVLAGVGALGLMLGAARQRRRRRAC